MRKLIGLFVFLVFVLSLLPSNVYSEEGSNTDSMSSDATVEMESETKVESETEVEYEEIEKDEEISAEEKLTLEQKMRLEVETKERMITLAKIDDSSCTVDSELQRKLYDLNAKLIAAKENGEDYTSIKMEIEAVNKRIRLQKEECIKRADSSRSGSHTGSDPTQQAKAIAVGKVCEISDDLKEDLAALKEKYVAAIEAKDFEESKRIREEAAKLEQKAQEERRKCFGETAPGLVKEARSTTCQIPQELYDRLEKNRYRVKELRSIDVELPEDLKKDIADLESKIAEYKAKCNALKVTSDVETKDVRAYYAQRMSEALETEDEDTKIQELKEIRREIDETIKNLVEQKKKLKFSEVDGLVDEVKFKAKSTSLGDSETTEDVEVEVEVEGSTVTIESNDEEVVLTEGDLTFTADDITVDENGIYVDGVLVKKLPRAVFEHNKNLERNAKKISELRLEAEDEKAVYKAKYEERRKLFGFIGVNAKNDVKIDAETGETISEEKPWWNGLSTEVESDASAELEAETSDDVAADAALEADTETTVAVEAN